MAVIQNVLVLTPRMHNYRYQLFGHNDTIPATGKDKGKYLLLFVDGSQETNSLELF